MLGFLVFFMLASLVGGCYMAYYVYQGISGAAREGHNLRTCPCQRCHNGRVAMAASAATIAAGVAMRHHNKKRGNWL